MNTYYCLKAKRICIIYILIWIILSFFSCSDLPSLSDIQQMEDRTPPAFIIDYPADGDIYEEIIWSRGKVIDDQESDNQEKRIESVTYRVENANTEIDIPIENDGAFLISFSTYYLTGEITIHFRATDISGNTGMRSITLIEPQPTPSPEVSPTPESTPIVEDTPIPTAAGELTPSPIPEPTPSHEPGTIWFVPDTIAVDLNNDFSTEIHINSGNQDIAAYGLTIFYDFNVLNHWNIEAGSAGFITAVNANSEGIIVVTGFDVSGTGPGSNLHFLTINWRAKGTGSTLISMEADTLVDSSYNTVGNPQGLHCEVLSLF